MKAKFFLINFVKIAVYWAVFYVAMIPFFGFSWKTLAGGFVLGFFAGMLNQLMTTLAMSKAMDRMPRIDMDNIDRGQLDDMMSKMFGQHDEGKH